MRIEDDRGLCAIGVGAVAIGVFVFKKTFQRLHTVNTMFKEVRL